MQKLTRFILILFSLSCCANIYAASSDTEAKSAELKQLNQQIAQLQSAIQKDQGSKTVLSQQMQKNLKDLAALQKRVATLNQELNKKQAALTTLKKNQLTNQQRLEEQRSFLTQQTKSAYLLMYNDDYNTEQRYLVYLNKLIPARVDNINQYKATVEKIQTQTSQVTKQKVALQTTLTQQQKTQQQLATAQQNQKKALDQLSTQLQNKTETLKKLIANRRALEQLIKNLAAAERARQKQKQLPVGWQPLPAGAPFTQLQGKLPWPTEGSIAAHFGSSIEQSELKYNGTLISAPSGQPVRAIYQGRIVFANWLQGLGLLTIVDHGNGYLSLYGHNQSLYKKVGDIVKAGDVIGSTGNAGQGPSGVYFEIRHNSRPLNPESWCRNTRK